MTATGGALARFGPVAVLVPVKSFGEAKLRLAPALDPAHRAELARAMATHVVRSAAPLPTAVVCDDAEVATWARDLDNGTNVICVPGDAGFTFSYGPGSFARHGAETHRLGLPLRVVREPSLSHDVDLPSDLVALGA